MVTEHLARLIAARPVFDTLKPDVVGCVHLKLVPQQGSELLKDFG